MSYKISARCMTDKKHLEPLIFSEQTRPRMPHWDPYTYDTSQGASSLFGNDTGSQRSRSQARCQNEDQAAQP